MPEEKTDPTGLGTPENQVTNWYDGMEDITGDTEVMKYIRDHDFKSAGALAKSGVELQKKLGSSFRLPEDVSQLNEEQTGQLFGVVRQLKKVPEKPEGYELTKPELPEGLPYDENLEVAFRSYMHDKGYGQKEVQDLFNFYNNALSASYNKSVEQQTAEFDKAEQELRIRKGAKYDEFMDNVKKFRIWATEKLGLGYVDEKTQETKSKLDDDLDRTRLGNSVVLNEVINYVYETFIAEAVPVGGSGEPGMEGGGVLSDSFYNNPEKP